MLAQEKLAGKALEVTMRDGRKMGAELFAKPGMVAPGIVMVPAVFGIDEEARTIARTYAEDGFPVLALDFFFRIHPGPLAREGEGREKAMARYAAFDVEQGVTDLADAVAIFKRMPECSGKVAVFGYCFGGRYAYRAASDNIADAGCAFHGTKIGLDIAQAGNCRTPLQLHFGGADPQVPMEEVERVQAALAGNPRVEISVYPGAAHGFTGKGRPSYHEAADTGSRAAGLRLLRSLR
jgi:carboxymethylenebutenolidase